MGLHKKMGFSENTIESVCIYNKIGGNQNLYRAKVNKRTKNYIQLGGLRSRREKTQLTKLSEC